MNNIVEILKKLEKSTEEHSIISRKLDDAIIREDRSAVEYMDQCYINSFQYSIYCANLITCLDEELKKGENAEMRRLLDKTKETYKNLNSILKEMQKIQQESGLTNAPTE